MNRHHSRSFLLSQKLQKSPLFFYGWVIVAFTFVLQFLAIGLSYYAFSVFLKPLTEILDTDRFVLSWTMSIQFAVIGLLSPLAGKWFATLPIRNLMLAGVACLSVAYLSLSQITSFWQLYILFGGLVGVGSVLLGVIPCNLLLANWFHAKRGTAIGVSQFGISISGTALVPAITWVLLSYDWQSAFLIWGVVAALVLVPLIFLFAVRQPEDMGLHPDGADHPVASDPPGSGEDWTFMRAFTHRDVWLLTLTVGPCYMGIASVILAMPSHITDMGISALDAAGVVAATTLTAAFAKPIFGIVSDHINKKVAVAIAISLQASGVLILLSADAYELLMAAGVIFGLGYGGMAPLWGVVMAARFGRAAFAKVMGANQPMLAPFNMLGLPATTFIYEQTGSYIPAFTALLGAYAIALVAISLFRLKGDETPS